MLRPAIVIAALLAGLGLVASTAAAEPMPQTQKDVEPYVGFQADQALLRKHFIHPAREGMKEVKASSGEACEAAQRIFSKMSFLFRKREEVLKLLGDPRTISDYNAPLDKDPTKPLVYVFDSGFGGLSYTLRFEQGTVMAVEIGSQN